MLSSNEIKRIKNNEESDRLARKENSENEIRAEAEAEKEKCSQKESAEFVNKILAFFLPALAIVFAASLLFLVFYLLG